MAAVCAVLTQILSLSRSCNFFSRFLQASFLDESLAMKNECFVYLCVFHKKKLYMYCIILSDVRKMKKDIWIVESVKLEISYPSYIGTFTLVSTYLCFDRPFDGTNKLA